MTIQVLKQEIHRLVDNADNEALLQEVYEKLKGKDEEEGTNWWDELDKP